MNHHFDWGELRVRDDEEQEGSDSEDSNSSYQPPTSEAENPDNISTELSEKVHKILDYINSLGTRLVDQQNTRS